MATDVAPRRSSGRLADRVRWLAVRGLAAVVTGVVVLGVGSRLVMLASRFLHPDAVGRLTEGGNRVGEFTVGGTAALLVFVGLFGGITAAFIWVVLYRWLPRQPAVVAVAAVALGGSSAVAAENRDFVILAPPGPDIVLLLAMLAVFGAVLPVVDRWLDARLPPARTRLTTTLYALPVVLGVPLLVPSAGAFFSRELCFCEDPPILAGIALSVVALASVWWWAAELRGAEQPATAVRRVGTAATVAAVGAGAIDLVGEVVAIL